MILAKSMKELMKFVSSKVKKRVLPYKIVDETGSHVEYFQYIAETFIDYFARIGHNMAESISDPPQKLSISQLHTSNANSFSMFLSSTDEVAQLIENLNDKKNSKKQ